MVGMRIEILIVVVLGREPLVDEPVLVVVVGLQQNIHVGRG